MPRLPHLSALTRRPRWTRPLPLLGAALLLFQVGWRGPVTGAAPLEPLTPLPPKPAAADAPDLGDVTQGALRVTRGDQQVECPLRHTDVQAEVSGFIARVRVTQTFENPYDEAIEAVYVFPLPHGSAVDDMAMVVGDRRVTGVVKRRRHAREAYEQAIAHGQTAALLEQERPNIFTQSVGNIPARQQVRVEIAYVDVLPYEGGRYEFHFPMVVGPRYIPGSPVGRQGGGWAPDTTRVPDASRITPPVLKPGFRNGHDVSLTVDVDAGLPIRSARVHNHQAPVQRGGRSRIRVTLPPEDTLPNKDFVLSYLVAGERPQAAVLSHAVAGDDGYFLLMVQPKEVDEALRASPPRDVCFLIDVSGSMSGQPIAKVSEAMERFFERMRPEDRLQVVTFAGDATRLFPGYVPATAPNVAEALRLTRAMQGGGGTEMMQGIRAVLADPIDTERVRIVVMLTDGYIGNEDEIAGEVGRRAGDQLRFWTVGIGSSPNRHLLDGVARQGGGASAVLGLQDDPAPLVGSVMDRIQRAQLSRLRIDWGGLDVLETYPARLGELWAGKPVFLLGRYRGEGAAPLTLSGLAEGEPVSFEVPVTMAAASLAENAANAVLAPAWARKKIEHLTDQMDVAGASFEMEEEVIEIALRYRLMSAYTSFVAVDESQAPVEGAEPPRRMLVPVPMPDGVSYEGVFGGDEMKEEIAAFDYASAGAAGTAAPARRTRVAKKDGRGNSAPPRLIALAPALAKPAPEAFSNGGVAGGVVGGVPGSVVAGVVGGTPAVPAATPAAPPGTVVPMPADKLYSIPREAEARRQVLADGRFDLDGARTRAAAGAGARAKKAGDLESAQRALAEAAMLAQARQRVLGVDDGTLSAVLAELAAVDAAREDQAGRSLPALRKPLGLVLRNQDLAAALQEVARAAGVALDVAPGSLEDVGSAFGSGALRVAYLDLRGASAARALTWLARPAGLTWRVREGRVTVESARHAGGPWVYEMGGAAAERERALSALKRAVGAADTAAQVTPLTPDFVLVSGTPAAHATATRTLGGVPSAGDADQQQRRAARAAGRARAALAAWTWPLLAAALEARVDDSAASELLEAARVPGVAAADALTLRALWVVATARGVSPADPTLARVWETLRAAAQPTLAAGPRLSGDSALYAQLLAPLAPGAWTLPPGDLAAPVHTSMAKLLTTRADAAASEAVLGGLRSRAVQGDDTLVLAALALRRGGGEGWTRFREQAAELARAANASGAALQAANRMDRARP